MDDRQRYDAATAGSQPPFAIVDLAAFRRNAAEPTRKAAGKPIRVASKSLRCRALLDEVLRIRGFKGIMAFTLPEALWLARSRAAAEIRSGTRAAAGHDSRQGARGSAAGVRQGRRHRIGEEDRR